MARRKNQPDSVRTKCRLAERFRAIRAELFGERGGPELARRLGLPVRTWYNYEAGVTVPAEVVLRFVELTSVEPTWLLHGQGPKFRVSPSGVDPPESDHSIEDLLRAALARLDQNESRGGAGPPAMIHQNGHAPRADRAGLAQAPAGPVVPDEEWLAARRDGRCIRVEGDAMSPIVADGAEVVFADADDDPEALEGKLVVAWPNEAPVVRWFQRSGRFVMLRAENLGTESNTLLIDLSNPPKPWRVRRVLWIGTPH